MIKRQLFAFASATLFGCSIATAADLPIRKAPPAPVPVFSWSGFYIGAHIGTGWGTTEAEINSFSGFGGGVGGFVIPVSQTQSNGFLGGVQGGYNWQLSPWAVIGVEADFSWTGIKGTSPCLVIFGCSTDHDWIATVAGRFGVTYDRALFYVKGGVAWAQTTYAASVNLGAWRKLHHQRRRHARRRAVRDRHRVRVPAGMVGKDRVQLHRLWERRLQLRGRAVQRRNIHS